MGMLGGRALGGTGVDGEVWGKGMRGIIMYILFWPGGCEGAGVRWGWSVGRGVGMYWLYGLGGMGRGFGRLDQGG